MNRKTWLKRKTPLRANPDKIKAWKNKPYVWKVRSHKRSVEESAYRRGIGDFLRLYTICPVTGGRTNQVHHSAKRFGAWLNLRRYWIAVSTDGHAWIEANKREAEKLGLMVRINETYKDHVAILLKSGQSLDEPIYYKTHP